MSAPGRMNLSAWALQHRTLTLFAMLAVAAGYWLYRHRFRRAAHAWSEAACPACITMHLVPRRLRLDHHDITAA